MTIRNKLVLSVSALLALTIGSLGYGVLAVSRSFSAKDTARRVRIIERSVEKAAQDALLQKDDLLLISYVNFLREQYPPLALVGIDWELEGRARALSVGKAPGHPHIQESRSQIRHPSEPSRKVALRLTIDLKSIDEALAENARRLGKIILGVALLVLVLGLGFSYWFARRITAPLSSMAGLAAEIGSGRLGSRLDWSSDDELGALARVFNLMSQRLAELDESKKNFVSSVTHELRSPLGAIESFLHLIDGRLKRSLNGEAAQCREYLGRIQTNVRRLSGFINDLLDVAKIEKGKMECVLKPMELGGVVSEVCQFFEAKAQQQGVKLLPRLPQLPSVQGDSERIRQVLVNLLANSLKFTPSGGEVVISGAQRREPGQAWVEVSVSDTGRGMEAADLEGVFEAFAQGKNVREGVIGTKGTGLGLYIVKSIIEQHGGRIEARSAPGRGTQIVFWLKTAA